MRTQLIEQILSRWSLSMGLQARRGVACIVGRRSRLRSLVMNCDMWPNQVEPDKRKASWKHLLASVTDQTLLGLRSDSVSYTCAATVCPRLIVNHMMSGQLGGI